MKKLMILGGSHYIIPVIETAKNLGLYVITCDYLPNNIAHKHSDEYCNVSVIDKDAVLDAARRLKIDGIISFACDPGVVSAAYVAEKMNLPFQGSYDSVRILQDKGLFRKFLAEHGFNSPKAKRYKRSEIESAKSDADYFTWPVIVKPVDSAGSKGVTRADSPDELDDAIRKAISGSLCGAFIIEDFITFKGHPTDSDHFTVNGELVFSAYSEQFFDDTSDNPYTPAMYKFPSLMEERHQKILTDDIQRLMKLLKMRTGIYNIETRIGSDDKPYIMELSPRGGGNKLAELEDMAYGSNLIENEIRKAVNMPLIPIEPNEISGHWCEMVIHANITKPEIFRRINIDDEIMNRYVKLISLGVKDGDIIRPFTGANAALGNMFLKFESREELDSIMSKISDWLRIEKYVKHMLRGGGNRVVTAFVYCSSVLEDWRAAA